MTKQALDTIVTKHHWILLEDIHDQLLYTMPTDETSFVSIIFQNDEKIIVSIPLKEKTYQYKTIFYSVDKATEYIDQRLYEYNN